MIPTTQFRKGLRIEHNSQPFTIVDFQHVNPGKGSAFVRTKLKSLLTGQVLEVTYKSGETVAEPDVETKALQYLFNDDSSYTFMDTSTYDQLAIAADVLGDQRYYIIEDSVVQATIYQGKPVGVEVDNFVELEIAETQPNIKGDTSSGGGKPATLSTGLTITVPFHLNAGDVVKVDTRTASYVEKVKSK